MRWSLWFASVSLLVSPAAAQLIDGVAAEVGNDVILLSEVEERAYVLKLRSGSRVTVSPEERRAAIEELVNERVLQVYALEQGMEVSQEEVEAAVERVVEDVRSGFSNDEEFFAALRAENMTESMLRENYRREFRDKLVRDRVIAAEIFDKVDVSRREIQVYYDEHQDEIERTEAEIQMRQLVVCMPLVEPRATQQREFLENLRNLITGPAEFRNAAKDHSEDTGSVERGGDLGWVTPGSFFEEFERSVQVLEPGQMSEPVQSRLGYHLIYLDERGERGSRVYHVLRTVPIDIPAQRDLRVDLDRTRAELAAGVIDWDQAVAQYPEHEQDLAKVSTVIRDSLPTPIATALAKLGTGEVSQVMEEPSSFRLIRVDTVRGGRIKPLTEMYAKISEVLRIQKLDLRFNEWIEGRRERTYVRILADG